MRRAAALLALTLAFPASAQGWAKAAQGWGKISAGGGGSYATTPPPTGCASGMVPYFNASLQLVCSPTVYAPTTDTTTSTGTIAARNVTVTALATPVITSVTPVLSRTCTITTVAGASLVDGDYFTIEYDTGLTVPIEFDATPGDGTTGGRIPLVFAPGDTADQIRDAIIVILNAAAGAKLTASSGGAATVSIVLDTPGAAGGTNSENVANAGFGVTAWANPTAATTYGYKQVVALADGTGTAASAEVTTAAGHATLSTSNFVRVVMGTVTGGALNKLYRTTGGAAPPKLIYSGTGSTFDDIGAAGTAETPATVNTTGVVTAGVLFAGGATGGTQGAPAMSFAADIDSGFYLSTNLIGVSIGGMARQSFGTTYFNIESAAGQYRLGGDTYWTRPAAATWQLGAANSATPVAQTLQAQGGAGTDIPGANLTIRSGQGTGLGARSEIAFVTPTFVGSGSAAQTMATRFTIGSTNLQSTVTIREASGDSVDIGIPAAPWRTGYFSRATLGSKSKAITDGSATTFATFTIADGAMYSGEIIYNVKAVQGTALQVLAGRTRFVATREGTTYTVAVSEVGTQTLAAAAGTLTGAIEISGTAGVITLAANFNTSLTPDTFAINARFDSPDAALALTFP